jgi:hypothetical protein
LLFRTKDEYAIFFTFALVMTRTLLMEAFVLTLTMDLV